MRYFDLMSNEYSPLAFDFRSDDRIDKDYFKDFLVYNAIIDKQQGFGTTHLFIDEDEKTGKKKILGYYTLRCSSLIISSEGNKKIGEPALEIAEFAVQNELKRTGIGSIMMHNIFAAAMDLNKEMLGIKHLVLCSVKDAESFYREKFEFKPIACDELIPSELRNIDCISMSVRLPKLNQINI
jgi:N-acetylglutamate synthase-like GNAT family acetyltransferase